MLYLPKVLKLFTLLILLALLLVGCGEASPTQVTSTASPSPTALVSSQPPTNTPPIVGQSPILSSQPPTFTAASATATPVISQSEAAARDKIQVALKNFASNAKNYNVKVSQSAEIKSGGATTTVEVKGSGSYATTNFYQKLELNSGDQTQTIEYYLTGNQGYQRLNALAVWRKLDPTLPASATPPTTLPTGAAGFQVSAAGQGQTQLRYTFPATQLFSQKDVGGPEILGLLSATELYRPFIANPDRSAQVEVKLGVNDANGLLVRREIGFTLTGAGSTLTYKATYDYSDLNTAVSSITPPPDLPK